MNKNTTPVYSSLSNTALLTFPHKTESNDTAFLSVDSDKELAIMFLDIRNFTGLMETKPAREVIHVVRRLFSMFGKIIQNFKGTVVEMAGDSLYAVFGMGSTIQEAINEGYQAAKMIFETIDLFNDTYTDKYNGRLLEIGIGFHTGNVIVSRLETENQKQLSVMGFAVNIASRLQAKTKELNNDMIISEEAYQLLSGKSVNHEQRTISLQGVSSRQQVRLLGKPYYGSHSFREEETHLNYVIAYSG